MLTAAVYGEIVAGNLGLGFLIEYSSNTFDVSGVFAALVLLMAIGLVIALCATRREADALRWKVKGLLNAVEDERGLMWEQA